MFGCQSIKKCAALLVGPLLVFTLTVIGVSEAADDMTDYTIYQGDPGFAPDPFPPWDGTQDGVTPAGFSFEIVDAACSANKAMECTVEIQPYADCILSDSTDPSGIGIGPGLLAEDVIGCITWGRTPSRLNRGLSFTNSFSDSSSAGRTDSTLYSSDGSNPPDTGGALHFTSGFAANDSCVANELALTYAMDSPSASSADAVADAIASDEDVALLDADPVDRTGLTPIATVKCVGGFSLVTYAPANLEETTRFHEDFNCGLRLIAANGTYDAICDSFDGGDRALAPFCFPASSFDEPSKECKQNEKKNKNQ